MEAREKTTRQIVVLVGELATTDLTACTPGKGSASVDFP